MSVKDRLSELKNNGYNKVYNDTVELCEMEDTSSENSDLIREIFKQVDEIRLHIERIDENTSISTRLFSSPTFHHEKKFKEEVDSRVTMSNAAGLKICGAIRTFEKYVTTLRPNSTAGRIARLQNASMRSSYSNALDGHEKFLETYRESKKSLLQQQIKLTNLEITDEECQSLLDSNKLYLFVDNIAAETQEAKLALQDVEERHKELLKIENSIREVKDLFVQMSMLVTQQQDLLDTVEYYAIQATENVTLGKQQLHKGNILRKKARSKRVGMIICIASGLIVLLLILFLT